MIGSPRDPHIVADSLKPVEPYKAPKPLPPLAEGLIRCRHCGYGVEHFDGRHWAIPMESPLPPGVALQNECPGRPVGPHFPRSFYGHEPS